MDEGRDKGPLKPRKLWIDSTPFDPENLKDQNSSADQSPARLRLTHFAPKTTLEFGDVKVGKTKSQILVVENPNPYEVDVKVEKFPWKKNFSTNEECFTVDEEGYYNFEITWTPKESGNCREIVMLKYDSGFRVHVVIIGHAESPKKKPRTRVRRGVGASTMKRISKINSNRPSSSEKSNRSSRGTENIDPLSLVSNIPSVVKDDQPGQSIKSTPPPSSKDSPKFQTPREAEHCLIRNALLPLHVVNSDNSRDSCGSITAPASPSGLDAPVIEPSNNSPCCSNAVAVKQSEPVYEPQRETFCIDPSVSKLSSGSPNPSNIAEVTGRPTYVLHAMKASAMESISANAFTTPSRKVNEVILQRMGGRKSTPRSHRRSKTFTKKVQDKPVEVESSLFPSSAKQDEKCDMLEYALNMIAEPAQVHHARITDATLSSATELVAYPSSVSEDSIEGGLKEQDTLGQLAVPRVEISPAENATLSLAVRKRTNTEMPNEDVEERLSSTHAHEGPVPGGLPVPDISLIKSCSPPKRKRRSSKFSEVSDKTAGPSKKVTRDQHRMPRASPRRRPKSGSGTPKARAIQRRRGANADETVPPLKASTLKRTPKSKPKWKCVPSPSVSKAKRSIITQERPRSAKKRKVKLPIKRLVLKPTMKPCQASPVTVRMPYSSRNMYYDEKWRLKQEYAYTTWLNYILTPDEFKSTLEAKEKTTTSGKGKNKTMHHSEVFAQKLDKCNMTYPALSKETASLRVYRIRKRLNRLRRAAVRLFESDEFISVVRKIEEAVESCGIMLRDDKQLWADIGNKARVLDFLLSFNPLWLKVGLEVTFGEELITQTGLDTSTLSNFISRKLLANSAIEQEFAHPTVPHCYKPGYTEKISRHVLKKFLILIFFLDQAKQKRLIDHDPCLFKKDTEFRNCKDILQQFSRDLLRGEGDFIKHLSFMGYKVKYEQTYIDEFEFGISNISVDLRDGIRLVRVVELLFHQHDLMPKLRVPAGSLLQKKHNVNIALKALEANGVDLCDTNGKKIEPDHVVRGHCEMTLALLWNMALFFQIEKGIDDKVLKNEIEYLKKNLRLKHLLENTKSLYADEDSPLIAKNKSAGISMLLLEWCRLVCAFKSIPVFNFSASFSDGRVLAILISHYQCNLISPSQINLTTTLSQKDPDPNQLDASSCSDMPIENETVNHPQLLKNEKANLRLVQNAAYEMGGIPNLLRIEDISNTIPDDKVIRLLLSYLCTRLLDISSENRAARTVQVAWRAYNYKKRVIEETRAAEELKQRKIKAASCIQSAFRGYLQRKKFEKLKSAVVTLQRIWRRRCEVRPFRKDFLKMKLAAITIQSAFRGKQARQYVVELRKDMEKRICAARTIQYFWRSILLRNKFLKKRDATIKIQRACRSYWFTRKQRMDYLAYKKAVVVIQLRWKETLVMRKDVAIFQTKKESAVLIQRVYRAYLEQKRTCSAIKIQRKWRAYVMMKVAKTDYKTKKLAIINLQSYFRGLKARKEFQIRKRQHAAAIYIQQKWKATMLMKNERNSYKNLRAAVIVIQSQFRTFQAIRIAENRRQKLRAVKLIQAKWRATALMRKDRDHFKLKRIAATTIQCTWRCHVAVKEFKKMQLRRHSAIIIQRKWRATLYMRTEKSQYEDFRQKILTIQTQVRGFQARKMVENMRKESNAAKVIQRKWRATVCMKKDLCDFITKRNSAITIQCAFRSCLARKELENKRLIQRSVIAIQRRWRATLLCRYERKVFLQLKSSVIKIQCMIRQFLAKKLFAKLKLEHESANIIQTRWKAELLMRRIRSDFIQMRNAAVTIQSHFRCTLARKQLEMLKGRDSAARIVQKYWKGFLLMKTARNDFLLKKSSAIRIQAFYRGYQAKLFVQQRKLEINSAKVIQERWRATLAMRREKNVYHEMKRSALAIQCSWKCFLARKELADRKRKRAASIVIQKWFQAQILAKKQKMMYQQMKNAAIRIQAFYRMKLARKLADEKRRQRDAAILIQRKWKATLLMRDARRRYHCVKIAIIKIQCFVRMMIAKNITSRMRAEHKAAIIIQRYWRGYSQMRIDNQKFLKLKSASIVIQSFFRGLVARQKLQALKKNRDAAITIQQWWKGVIKAREARDAFLHKRQASIIIQKYWRRFKAQQIVKKMWQRRHATLKIQAFWRGYQAMKVERQTFMRKRDSAIKIQSAFRSFLARKELEKLQLMHVAARLIQQKWQAVTLMRRARSEFLHRKFAAIIIQCAFRSFISRKTLNQLRARRDAAVFIQQKWKATATMMKERRTFLKTKAAVLTIQCGIRCVLAKKQLELMKERRLAAIVIQRRWRATILMRETRSNFLRKKSASVVIQKYFRRVLALKTLKHLKNRNNAALKIQRKWRATILMEGERADFLQQKKAAIVLQCATRCLIAKNKLKDLRCKNDSAKCIQAHWRAFILMRKQKSNFIKIKEATIKIQSVFRCISAIEKLKIKKKQYDAAVIIQSHWKATVLMKKDRDSFLKKLDAVVVLQTYVRRFNAMKTLKQLKTQSDAAVTLQRFWKSTLLMRKEQETFLKKKKACTLIQSAIRCYLAKNLLLDLKRKNLAACKVQNWWRTILRMKKEREKYILTKKCVITIQAYIRGYLARKRAENLCNQENAVRILQQRWVATLLMRKQREIFLDEKLKIVTVQSAVRRFLAKSKLFQLKQNDKAAKKIQLWWVGCIETRKQRNIFLELKHAAIVIQSSFRRYSAMKKLSHLRKRQNATKLIQERWRSTLKMREDRQKFLRKLAAVVKIQATVRGFLAKKKFVEMGKRNEAAKVIQTRWKAMVLMRKEREAYLQQRNAIITIQKTFRCLIAKGKLAEVKRRRDATILIQRKWRATVQMRNQVSEFIHLKRSVIIVQASIRKFLAVRKLEELKRRQNAAMILQKNWKASTKMRKDRQKFLSVVNAIRTIQRVYRGYVVRKAVTDSKIIDAKFKCAEANRAANKYPARKICNRMNSALSILLDAKSYDTVYATLEDLYALSMLLPYCCERISEDGGTGVLCRLITSSNRSFHAAFVQKFSISILLNLIKNPTTRSDTSVILGTADLESGIAPIEMLVMVLSRFRDKGGRDPSHALVFCAACSLLLEFCRDKANVEILRKKTKSVDMVKYIKKETMNKMKFKAKQEEEGKRKKLRDSVGFISLSSCLGPNSNLLNSHSLLDTTVRETSFARNMDSDRVSTPKTKRRKWDSENKDPAMVKKNPQPKGPSAKKIVSNLFGGENPCPPQIKQALAPQKALWHTNIPIHRSKKVTKPLSPKFKKARRMKVTPIMPATTASSADAAEGQTKRSQSTRVAISPKLTKIDFDERDPVSCINALADVLA